MDSEVRKQHDFQRSHSARVQRSSYENYAPGHVPAMDSFQCRPGIRAPTAQQQAQPTRQIFVDGEDPESQRWMELDAPPTTDSEVDQSRFEQRVQVNFRVQDGVPQDQYKAVLRRSGGSMEMLTSQDDTTEPSYKLSAIDQDLQAITTSVSFQVDPEEGEESGSHGDNTVVFDSNTLPSISFNADTCISTTVMEFSEKTVTSGKVIHSYQVELFMKKEGELLQEVLNGSAADGNTEVED